MANPGNRKIQSIYIADKEQFDILRSEVQTLWYKTYNEYINITDVLIKSLYTTKQVMENKLIIKKDITISSKYGRIT